MAPKWRESIPPLPNTEVRNVTRVFSASQVSGGREHFEGSYPNGLPITYKMVQSGNEENGVSDTYNENHLSVGFYTQPPREAESIFSTERGTRLPRYLAHVLPARYVHLWSGTEIQKVCNSLRLRFWDCMREMPVPRDWVDLYYYFDSYDLYHYGALNLWNIIHHLISENHILYHEVEALKKLEIGRWADEWLANQSNKSSLLDWTADSGSISSLLSADDLENLGANTEVLIECVSSALLHRRTLLLQDDSKQPQQGSADLDTAISSGSLQNWLGKDSPVPWLLLRLHELR